MDRNKLLKPLVFLMILIFAINSAAMKLHWYSSIFWMDMLGHFSGGLWVGLFFFWFFSIGNLPVFRLSITHLNLKLIAKTLFFVLFIGIAWEIFEFIVYNRIGGDPFDVVDSSSDIFFDLSGGIAALLYLGKKTMSISLNKLQLEQWKKQQR